MPTYLALLRGINVSGQKAVNMGELKLHLERLGLAGVQTYIQSGNVLFEHASSDPRELAERIETALNEVYGFRVPTLVKSQEELARIAAANPYVTRRNEAVESLHVTFLSEVPSPELVEKLAQIQSPPDEFILTGDAIYLFCPNGYGRTKFTNTFFEARLNTSATTRNWKTVLKLVEMASDR